MSQRYDYQRPITLQIDLNQATYQSFLNCINSFQGLETESEMLSQAGSSRSTMSSRVSLERFLYNLGVLAGLTLQDDYKPDMEPPEAFKYWAQMVKHLKEADFFKHARRISHL